MEISPDAHMGPVELSVSDLDRSLAYWQDAIGLRVLSRENGTAELGADTPLVRVVEEPGARPAAGFTGLFHVALLVPDRPSLGRFLAHAVRDQIPLTGLSDHVVSEAIYLRDPDDNGVELYRDRPREEWPDQMFTAPLDVEALLAELD
jgi:catechol 2,3-dioxygenase